MNEPKTIRELAARTFAERGQSAMRAARWRMGQKRRVRAITADRIARKTKRSTTTTTP